jgi:hypothetical protein
VPESRRYPRVAFEHPAEMQYRIRSQKGVAARPVRVPVLIRNISCEGARIELESGERPLLRNGESITLEFDTARGEMSLPGNIAWQRSTLGQQSYIGVGLRLELAPASVRQRYAHWIVALTQQALALRNA